MPLPSQALLALQAAGAAIYAADAELKKTVQIYADRVQTAMQSNPFDLENDDLFKGWRTVAHLSQTIDRIEVEIKNVYIAAAELDVGERPSVGAVPKNRSKISIDAALKSPRKKRPKDVLINAASNKPLIQKEASRPLTGNTAKVLEKLLVLLNPDGFEKINKSSLAKDVGLPQGSIGASISKLLRTGRIAEGAPGTFKLEVAKTQ